MITGTKLNKTVDRFLYYEPNPRGKNFLRYDCAIRAVAKAANMTWFEAYDFATAVGREFCSLPDDLLVMKRALKKLGFRYVRIKDSNLKCTVAEFAETHEEGTFVLRAKNHYVTCIDGFYYDNGDVGDYKINSYFEKQAKEEE